MLDALEKKLAVDAFIVYTDSETWAHPTWAHPTNALEQYRQKMSLPAKLIVCGMVSNNFTIADPADAGMLDVVGFDTATPQIISEFAKD
jgi:60 kDa SS-A/Ro ribonucleoprotein